MQLLAVLMLVTFVFGAAALVVQWEDRRAARVKAARVRSALVRLGEEPGSR